jgi:hypothetical protein
MFNWTMEDQARFVEPVLEEYKIEE